MKKEISIILMLLLSFSVAATTLDIYPEDEDATGFIFSSEEFTSEDDADIYAKEVEAQETATFYFFANIPTIKHKGKEDIDEFRCDELNEDDYELQEEIKEKHGYCILTYDRDQIIKIYVVSVTEQSKTVEIDWGEHEETLREEEPSEETEEPFVEEVPGEEKEEGPEAAKIIIIEEPEEEEEPILEDENKTDEKKQNKLTDIIGNLFRTVKNNPVFIGLIIMLVVYSILNIILAEARKKWKEKKDKEKKNYKKLKK